MVLALLTLMLAVVPSTRGLGVLAACGLVVAALFVLLILPPLLALFGPRLFWPFVPRPGSADTVETGPWHRIAERVARRPGLIGGISVLVLAILATGYWAPPSGCRRPSSFA